MYKLTKNLSGEVSSVLKTGGAYLLSIPFDPDNTDYQEFLRWCEAGNTPEPADQPE